MKQFNIEVISPNSKPKVSAPVKTIKKAKYELNGHKVRIVGKLDAEILNVDINELKKTRINHIS